MRGCQWQDSAGYSAFPLALFRWRAARSYSVDGLVVAVNSPVFTVAHRPIPGYMQAMTMEFRAASPSELDDGSTGGSGSFRTPG